MYESDNIFPIFYSGCLSQITIGDFRKRHGGLRFFSKKFACGQVVAQATIVSYGSKSDEDFFSKNHEKFHISPRYLIGYLAPTLYRPSVEAKTVFSFRGEMKYHFHRQLLLRLGNFSNKRCNYMTAFCPPGPSKIVNFRGPRGAS